MLKAIPLICLFLAATQAFSQRLERDYILKNHIKEIKVLENDTSENADGSDNIKLIRAYSFNDSGNINTIIEFAENDTGSIDTAAIISYRYDSLNRNTYHGTSIATYSIYTIYDYVSHTRKEIIISGSDTSEILFKIRKKKKNKEIWRGYENNKRAYTRIFKTRGSKQKNIYYTYRSFPLRRTYFRTKEKRYYDPAGNLVKTIDHIRFSRGKLPDHSKSITVMTYNSMGDMLTKCTKSSYSSCEYFEYVKW